MCHQSIRTKEVENADLIRKGILELKEKNAKSQTRSLFLMFPFA
jgi:hypothetical protein